MWNLKNEIINNQQVSGDTNRITLKVTTTGLIHNKDLRGKPGQYPEVRRLQRFQNLD